LDALAQLRLYQMTGDRRWRSAALLLAELEHPEQAVKPPFPLELGVEPGGERGVGRRGLRQGRAAWGQGRQAAQAETKVASSEPYPFLRFPAQGGA